MHLTRRQALKELHGAALFGCALAVSGTGCSRTETNHTDLPMDRSTDKEMPEFFGLWPTGPFETPAENPEDVAIVRRVSQRREAYYGTVVAGKRQKIYDCPCDPLHVTHSYYTHMGVRLRGAERFPFISADEDVLMDEPLAFALRDSGLTGFEVKEAEAFEEDFGSLGAPDKRVRGIYFLQVTAPYFHRSPVLKEGVFDGCPFCREQPLVCPGCGDVRIRCPNCGEQCFQTGRPGEEEKDAKRYDPDEIYGPPGPGLDLAKWHRTDFSGHCWPVITRRALDFLVDFGARPLIAVRESV